MHHGRVLRHDRSSLAARMRTCAVAPSGQAPKPRSGAPQARGLTAKGAHRAIIELPRCALLSIQRRVGGWGQSSTGVVSTG